MKPVFFLLFLAFWSCGDDSEIDPGLVFTRKIENLQMENFKIPDSVNTALIIASYYNTELDEQTLFVFADSSKKKVLKLDYPAARRTESDTLEILKRNEFRSSNGVLDYVVHPNSVSIIHVRRDGENGMASSKEFRRTDRD